MTFEKKMVESWRLVRFGNEIWRLRVAQPDEYPEPLARGGQWVRIEGPGEVRHWVVMRRGEFGQASDARLRALVASIESATAGLRQNPNRS